jgi:hypothetical protein
MEHYFDQLLILVIRFASGPFVKYTPASLDFITLPSRALDFITLQLSPKSGYYSLYRILTTFW